MRFSGDSFPPERLAAAKAGREVSVCVPARNEEATVGAVVAAVRELADRWGVVDEVLVVDDGSTDSTAAVAARAGARVVLATDVLVGLGPGTGKGEALWKSLAAATGDVLVFVDADLIGFDARFVTGLLGPLLVEPEDRFQFVKGSYERPLAGLAGEGGRVTELVARPLLSLLFPQLAGIEQPLGGEFASRREVLEALPFVQGYGVDMALLIDVAAAHGPAAIAQVDLGVRRHRNRPLAELKPQAEAVAHAALHRAGVAVAAAPSQRPPMCSVDGYRSPTGARP